MQQAAKKRFINHQKKLNQTLQAPSLSSFSLVHRFGKIEIIHVVKAEKKEDYFKIPDFPGWSMPEHPIGYIKCKKYDFL
jgi:hypothetical protein